MPGKESANTPPPLTDLHDDPHGQEERVRPITLAAPFSFFHGRSSRIDWDAPEGKERISPDVPGISHEL